MYHPYELTEDGYETPFQVNYLSHFLLTNLLLPKIKETSQRKDKQFACRVVNVASNAHVLGYLDDLEQLGNCKVYTSGKSYSDSKLCQVIHARYLDKLLQIEDVKVNAYSLHPGVIPSDLWDHVPWPVGATVNTCKWLFRTTEDGADTVMYTSLSPTLEGVGGVYINSCEVIPPNKQVEDVTIQKNLWERSLQLTDI